MSRPRPSFPVLDPIISFLEVMGAAERACYWRVLPRGAATLRPEIRIARADYELSRRTLIAVLKAARKSCPAEGAV